MKQGKAKLRVCASCEWIFKLDAAADYCGCPKCNFGHYGARYVYGNSAYRFAVTQRPWYNKKMDDYAAKLHREIQLSKETPHGKTWKEALPGMQLQG